MTKHRLTIDFEIEDEDHFVSPESIAVFTHREIARYYRVNVISCNVEKIRDIEQSTNKY